MFLIFVGLPLPLILLLNPLIGSTDYNAKIHQLFGVPATDIADNSFAAKITSKTGIFSTFTPATDALEGISDSVSSLSPVSTSATSATLTVGTSISGTYINTTTDDDIRYTLAQLLVGLKSDFILLLVIIVFQQVLQLMGIIMVVDRARMLMSIIRLQQHGIDSLMLQHGWALEQVKRIMYFHCLGKMSLPMVL